MSVVDAGGDILGLVRTPTRRSSAPTSPCRRRAARFSSRARTPFPDLAACRRPRYLVPAGATSSIAAYASAFRDFVGAGGELDGRTAWSTRAIGNLHRPTFPDGIAGTPPGPLRRASSTWSPFNVGFQLDLVYNQLVKGALGDTSTGCAGTRGGRGARGFARMRGSRWRATGCRSSPAASPSTAGRRSWARSASRATASTRTTWWPSSASPTPRAPWAPGSRNAPAPMRADQLAPQGARLRYVQCPQSPFNDSTEQNACAGL